MAAPITRMDRMPWLWPFSWIQPALAMPNTSRMAAHSAKTEVNRTMMGSSSER